MDVKEASDGGVGSTPTGEARGETGRVLDIVKPPQQQVAVEGGSTKGRLALGTDTDVLWPGTQRSFGEASPLSAGPRGGHSLLGPLLAWLADLAGRTLFSVPFSWPKPNASSRDFSRQLPGALAAGRVSWNPAAPMSGGKYLVVESRRRMAPSCRGTLVRHVGGSVLEHWSFLLLWPVQLSPLNLLQSVAPGRL